MTKDLIKRLGQAIEGPHDPQGHYANHPAMLAELRKHRWAMLTEQDRGVHMAEAHSILAELRKTHAVIERDPNTGLLKQEDDHYNSREN